MVGMSYTVLPACPPTPEAVRAALEGGRAVPATTFRLDRRIHRLSHRAARLTWDNPVAPSGISTRAPMIRIPRSRNTLYMKLNNGFGIGLMRRF
jgi:hypothetical protein